jgi:glutathione reductase (NADPH)
MPNLSTRTATAPAFPFHSGTRVAEDCSGFKVLIEDDTDRILGAHLLGPHAEEIINLFVFAIATNARAGDLRDRILAYPTVASDIRYML